MSYKKPVAIVIDDKILCKFGCNKVAMYITASNKPICDSHPNKCPVNKEKNSKGLKVAHANGAPFFKFDETARAKSNESAILKAKETAFTRTELNGNHRKYLIEIKGYFCEICKISNWNDAVLTLEIDHINGIRSDNAVDNLRLLCPNCHSQTSNYRSKNIANPWRRKYSKEHMYELYKTHGSIHKALIAADMAPKGANYKTMKKIILEMIDLDKSHVDN
jgi:hypothetical protein